MTRAKWMAPLLILVLAGFGAFVIVQSAPSIERVESERLIPTVRVLDAHPQTLRYGVHTQGTVQPRTESSVVPEISGRVVWISPSLASGGFFEEGDPLLRIEQRDYELALDRAKAAVKRARSELDFAASELERQEGLSRGGVASRSELSDARRTASVAEANLFDARAAVEQAERDLARTEIRAPFQGRVRDEEVDVGQFVTRGSAIARIYATDYVEVRLPIADAELAFLDLRTPGADGTSGPDTLPRVFLRATFAGQPAEWIGHVVRTEGAIDLRSRLVNVVARVEDPYQRKSPNGGVPLPVGLFVQAEIEGPQAENVIVVPRYAVRENSRVLVVDANDRLHTRTVEILRIDRDDVLVQGPLPGDVRICISALPVVVEGMQVRTAESRATKSTLEEQGGKGDQGGRGPSDEAVRS